MMGKGTDKIVDRFLHPTVMPIVGYPNNKILAKVQLQLNTNATIIHSHPRNVLLQVELLPRVTKRKQVIRRLSQQRHHYLTC